MMGHARTMRLTPLAASHGQSTADGDIAAEQEETMPGVYLHSVRTSLMEPASAAEDLLTRLGGITPKLAVLFASSDRDHAALNRALRDRLPKGTRLIGATTGGEIDREGIHAGTAVLGALIGDFDLGIGIGRGLSSGAVRAGATAIETACRELGVRPGDVDSRRYVGIVIDDGFQYKKEELLLGMMEQNQDLILVGGGAAKSENGSANQTALLHADGMVANDAALVALLRTDAPWAALRSHWYHPSGQTLRITKVDASHTRAIEIDGKRAATRYAEIIGVPVGELEFGTPHGFAHRPTALKVGREYFLRSPWKPLEDGSILFANLLEEGMELELMASGDLAERTREFFVHDVPRRVESPRAALLFHCAGRNWFAASTGKSDELSATFREAPPCVGMNVHFEIYCGFNINTTLTTLVLGEHHE
jgi:hypothetical protein